MGGRFSWAPRIVDESESHEVKYQINHHHPTPSLSIKFILDSDSHIPIKIDTASVFSKNGCRDRTIMNEVGAADRERLLRSKRAELRYINYFLCTIRKRILRRVDACYFHDANCCSGIVGSRKRKLRELFAVCDNEAPIPKVDLSNPDAPPTTIAEGKFFEVTDILLYVTSPHLQFI